MDSIHFCQYSQQPEPYLNAKFQTIRKKGDNIHFSRIQKAIGLRTMYWKTEATCIMYYVLC